MLALVTPCGADSIPKKTLAGRSILKSIDICETSIARYQIEPTDLPGIFLEVYPLESQFCPEKELLYLLVTFP